VKAVESKTALNRRSVMKKLLVFALFVGMSLMAGRNASAQNVRPRYQTIQYTVPPVPIQAVCNVNGVNYPVDFGSHIWGRNDYDEWFVIGQIVATPNGYVAVRLDGVRFRAFCQ
jgi:hypothetical protein